MFFLDMCVKNFNKKRPFVPFNTVLQFKAHFNGPHTKTHFPKQTFLTITGVDKTYGHLDGWRWTQICVQLWWEGGVVGGNFYDPRQSNFGDKVHYYHSYMK